jgi:tetratricopeptide (TPR) repeat protein
MGDEYQAGISYRRASSLFGQTSRRYLSAMSLDSLGDSYHRAGNVSEALGTWRQALDILDELAHPDASEVRRKIHDSGPAHSGSM